MFEADGVYTDNAVTVFTIPIYGGFTRLGSPPRSPTRSDEGEPGNYNVP